MTFPSGRGFSRTLSMYAIEQILTICVAGSVAIVAASTRWFPLRPTASKATIVRGVLLWVILATATLGGSTRMYFQGSQEHLVNELTSTGLISECVALFGTASVVSRPLHAPSKGGISPTGSSTARPTKRRMEQRHVFHSASQPQWSEGAKILSVFYTRVSGTNSGVH